jgi:farnesyl diphosphate synthase
MFIERLRNCQLRTEKQLKLSFLRLPESRLKDGMTYAVLNGGKRLRAFLVMESSFIFDVNLANADQVAAAVECLHAYSLVHDDLPSMDDDSLRRGLPTVHVKWDEATAILVGDALQSLSYEILSSQNLTSDPKVSNRLVNSLANASGAAGMALGQMQDILAENSDKPLTMEEIKNLQMNKTGALIQWSAMAGAHLAGGCEQILAPYSNALGLAFQITDDILDIEGNTSIVGKKVCKDTKAGKATFVSLMGLDQAKQEVKMLIAEACDSLNELGSKAEGLRELAHYLISREK